LAEVVGFNGAAQPGEEVQTARGRRRVGIALAGLVVTLILTGQAIYLARAVQTGLYSGISSGTQAPHHGSLESRLSAVIGDALGPSDRSVRRFRVTSVRVEPNDSRRYIAAVRWAIDNDLTAGTVGNGAEVDVYAALRAIFTSDLPVSAVRLTGTYPMERRGKTRETVVMRLEMDQAAARLVQQTGWDELDPQTLWPLLHRQYVDPALQPLSDQ
jgi:hypothetical protein